MTRELASSLANELVKSMEDMKILVKITGRKRNR
jgi:hypothetical protein